MLIITLQRAKCIGCNYCEEVAPELFSMSKKDGKANLSKAINRKGFHTVKLHDISLSVESQQAEESCPAKIIKVKIK